MSIQAKLHLDDKTFNVLECRFSFYRQQGNYGRPSGVPRFRGVNLVLEASRDNVFWEWAISPTEKKQAELHFTPRIEGTKSRKLQLIDAYCVRHRVHFKNSETIPMTETIHLTCGGFKDLNMGDEFSEHWRETFPMPEGVEETVLEVDDVPRLLECYLTDKNNNRIKKGRIGETVILNIKTEFSVGKTFTVNLNDKTADYKYNGKVLVNDTLKDFVIEKDLEKIPLEVIAQQKQD